MPQTDNSIWAYHKAMLKSDAIVIAGAVSGIGLVTLTAATLHEFSAPLSVVLRGSLTAAVLLVGLSIAGRELLRRKQSTSKPPLAGRYPKSAFLATCLASVMLTAGLTRTQLETGIAVFQGRQHMQAGNYQAAAESFGRVIELAPNRAKGYCLRGLAMYYSGQTDAAYDDLQFALTLQPNNKTAQALFMATLEQMDPKDEATQGAESIN